MTFSHRLSRRHAIGLALVPLALRGQLALAQEGTASSDSEVGTQLPAADLPSMNQQGYLFEIESSWSGSFDSVPREAPVYRMDITTYDAESFGNFAGQLGIEGDAQDQGDGNFEVSGDAGTLYAAPGFSQFISTASIPEGDLPSDDEAIAHGREWLRQSGVLPADAGDGVILSRSDSPARVIVQFQPARPENIIAAFPNIVITMGPEAVILEASFRWYNLTVIDTYALTPAETAWAEVSERRSFLQVDTPEGLADPGTTLRGRADYTGVIVAYTSSGVMGETQYLQPVYVFNGTVKLEGSDQSYPIRAYVPSLVNSQQPVG